MFADYHLHTEFSDDSEEMMELQIQRGIDAGFTELCFTDHVDYGVKRDWDDPRGVLQRTVTEHGRTATVWVANVNYPEYFGKLLRMRAVYGDKITIRSGLEFGIQSGTVAEYQKLFDKYKAELDFVLFSMHQVDNRELWNQDFQSGQTQQQYNERYYEEIYNTMNMFRDYSCLAHLDMITRYDQAGTYPFEKLKDLIAEILKTAIRDGKGIEVNTSSWRYGLSDTTPSRDILKLYKDLGGRIITVGSDAHKASDLGDHNRYTYDMLRDELGFTEVCTFEKMEPLFHKL